MTYAEEMRRLQRLVLERRLQESNGCVSAAARLAGVHRNAFYKMLAKVGIPPRTRTGHRGSREWAALQ
jgi:transcriptional regulator of acetoin/glycerol metabolism